MINKFGYGRIENHWIKLLSPLNLMVKVSEYNYRLMVVKHLACAFLGQIQGLSLLWDVQLYELDLVRPKRSTDD